MFDLNPAVDHLMLDRDLADPFDRDLPRPRRSYPDLPPVVPAMRGVERARHALGTRLIALGSALTLDERSTRRSVAR